MIKAAKPMYPCARLHGNSAPPSESVRQRIAAAATLLHWSERILTADSLEAVLH